MSEYGDIHICRRPRSKYLVRVRRYGYQKYEIIGKPHKTSEAAWKKLCSVMGQNDPRQRIYKRGDVLMVAVNPLEDWYGPAILHEIVVA